MVKELFYCTKIWYHPCMVSDPIKNAYNYILFNNESKVFVKYIQQVWLHCNNMVILRLKKITHFSYLHTWVQESQTDVLKHLICLPKTTQKTIYFHICKNFDCWKFSRCTLECVDKPQQKNRNVKAIVLFFLKKM